jgi:hypothetical protein
VTYTILSARWGNDDHTSAVALSEEVGHVAISEVDTPDMWAALMQWCSYGHRVEDVPPPPPPLTKADKLDRLLGRAGLSIEDLRAALAGG